MGLFCYRIREQFSDLLDNRLSSRERDTLLKHLARCTECAGDYELFQKTQRLVSGLNPPAVPAGFTEQVLARVRASASSPEPAWMESTASPGGTAASWGPWANGLAAAAAIAALVFGAWSLVLHPRTNSVTAPLAGHAAPPSAGTSTPSLPAKVELAGGGSIGSQGRATVPAPSSKQAAPALGSSAPGQLAAGGALAHATRTRRTMVGGKVYVDSLYDQPVDGTLPLDQGYVQKVGLTGDSGVKVVPVHGRTRGTP